MPIKKSAVLLLLVTACSVSLLVFSADTTPAKDIAPLLPAKCNQGEICTQVPTLKPASAWDMISQIMWRYDV